jgi:hypothetical protein
VTALGVAVDPGKHACGVALLTDSRVAWAGYVKNPDRDGEGLRKWRWMGRAVHGALSGVLGYKLPVFSWVTVERMQQYPGSPINPNNLMELAGVAGSIAAELPAQRYLSPLPRDWIPERWKNRKRKADKQTHAEVKDLLLPSELVNVHLPRSLGLQHNVWDGVALGLWTVERLWGQANYSLFL